MANLKINSAGNLICSKTTARLVITCPSGCTDPTFSDAFTSTLNSTYTDDTTTALTTGGKLYTNSGPGAGWLYRKACVPSIGETWDLSVDVDWIGSTTGMSMVSALSFLNPIAVSQDNAVIYFEGTVYKYDVRTGSGTTTGVLSTPTPASGDTMTLRVTRNSSVLCTYKFIVNGTTAYTSTGNSWLFVTSTEAGFGMKVVQNTTSHGTHFDNFSVA